MSIPNTTTSTGFQHTFQSLFDVNIASYTANDIIVVNPSGTGLTEVSASSLLPAVGTGVAGDIPVFNNSPPALFVDSGVNISVSNLISAPNLSLQDTANVNNIVMGANGILLQSGPNLPLVLDSHSGSVAFSIAGFNGMAGQVITNYNGTNCNWANPSGVNTFVDFSLASNLNVIVVAQQNIKCYNFQPASSYTITLPLITGSMLGHMIYIMTGDTSLNANTDSLAITPTVPNTIDGNVNLTLTGSGVATYGFNVAVSIIQLYCDGTQWISNIPS